jgi:hypothetical protein
MSEQENQHFLDTTPVDVAVKALQRQVDQLKRIIDPTGTLSAFQSTIVLISNFIYLGTTSNIPENNVENEKELKEQIKSLEVANAKAEYRIKMLLRTLEEKDKK